MSRLPQLGFLSCVLLFSLWAYAGEEDGAVAPKGMVKVDQNDLVPLKPPSHDFELKPYGIRRGHWGLDFGFAYSSYVPINYSPAFLALDYKSTYGNQASSPLMEAQFVIKRNLSLGSAGIEIAGGSFSANSVTDLDDSTLQVMQVRVGAIFVADMLFSKPYVAPYGSVGAYVNFFNESQTTAATNFKGNTQPAPYVTIGAQFGLDWLDSVASRQAYESADLQATFLFVEIRKYFASNSANDPDFESGIAPGAGLRLEF